MIYFTADLHLGHKNILGYCKRPFATIEEHDEAILQNIADTVCPLDALFILGDLAFADISRYQDAIRDIDCYKVLIAGNHDKIWCGSATKHYAKHYQSYAKCGFDAIDDGDPADPWMMKYESLGWGAHRDVVLHHFPSEGDSHPTDRYREYRVNDHAESPILCGHVHDSWLTKGRNVNVGVDVWGYKPVSPEDLYPIIRGLEGGRYA